MLMAQRRRGVPVLINQPASQDGPGGENRRAQRKNQDLQQRRKTLGKLMKEWEGEGRGETEEMSERKKKMQEFEH